MPKNHNRNQEDLSIYTTMSTEELETLLRLDSEAPSGNELDTDTLLHILGVLAERKSCVKSSGKTSQEAWESFQKHYLPDDSDILDSPPVVTRPVKKLSPQIRRLIAAAAVIAILIVIPFSAKALGLWSYIARWSKDHFWFAREGGPNTSQASLEPSMKHASLQETLIAAGKDPSIAPTWIPEGFVLESIKVDENPVWQHYLALYTKGDDYVHVSLNYGTPSDAIAMEISSDLVELYRWNDKEFYIFYNNDRLIAAWIDEFGEYSISGDLTLKELKEMLNSIEKGA